MGILHRLLLIASADSLHCMCSVGQYSQTRTDCFVAYPQPPLTPGSSKWASQLLAGSLSYSSLHSAPSALASTRRSSTHTSSWSCTFAELFALRTRPLIIHPIRLMLIGGYFHANQAAKLGPYIWPCFLIWGFDRFLRLFRVVYFNNNLYAGGRGLDATLELLSPQFVKLSLTRPPQFKWTPGQAAFLIAPGVSRIPVEAHPFTIASVDSRYRLAGSLPQKSPRMDLMESEASSMSDDTVTMPEKDAMDTSDVLPYWEEVEFFINVRDGFTKRLAAAARKGEKVRVFVDGPYGFSPNVKSDDTVVLVAGAFTLQHGY